MGPPPPHLDRDSNRFQLTHKIDHHTKYYNKCNRFILEKTKNLLLEVDVGRLQLESYCQVVEGGLPNFGQKGAMPEVDECGS